MQTNTVLNYRMHISQLVIDDKEPVLLNTLSLDDTNRQMILQMIKEHRYADQLRQYGLPVNNKLLLYGASGCGKTSAAKAIAQALGKKFMPVNLSNIISARIGETARHMQLLFDAAAREKAVLFLDEFDQLAKARSTDDKDVGEMRRLVNSLIQLIDYLSMDAVLVCASNHLSFIDGALLRRFQLKAAFVLPGQQVLDAYYNRLLENFPPAMQQISRLYGISFAEARDHAFTAVKNLLINEMELQHDIVAL